MSAQEGRKLVGDTPWRVQATGVGIACNGSWGFDVAEWGRLHPVPQPILELVCESVNSHDSLVASLQRAVERVTCYERWTGNELIASRGTNLEREINKDARVLLVDLRAALDKVTE